MWALEELRAILAELKPARLAEVRDFAEFLRQKDRIAVPVVVEDLFGTLNASSAAALEQTIDDACERVDADAW